MPPVQSCFHCQFQCHVLIALFFYQNSLKMKLFLRKNAKISSAGGFAPRPPSFVEWGLRPQTPKTAPPIRISRYTPALSSGVLCANPTHKYPNCRFKYYLHLPQHTSARAAFQLLHISKTKARNQRKFEDDIRLTLSSTKPRIPKLALWLQSLPSH